VDVRNSRAPGRPDSYASVVKRRAALRERNFRVVFTVEAALGMETT
jgi:hypothetical protein